MHPIIEPALLRVLFLVLLSIPVLNICFNPNKSSCAVSNTIPSLNGYYVAVSGVYVKQSQDDTTSTHLPSVFDLLTRGSRDARAAIPRAEIRLLKVN